MKALSATLSATTVIAAAAVAAFAGTLVLTMLSRPAPLPALPETHSAAGAPFGTAALLPAAPLLDDCAPFAPAPHATEVSQRLTPRASATSGTSPPRSDTAMPDDGNDGGCDPDGGTGFGLGEEIGGLGSGWIISADGVMRMNPYSLSDTHSITVRPAEPLLEFKGRIIGLGGAGAAPLVVQPMPEGKERRPALIVRDDVVPRAGQGARVGRGPADFGLHRAAVAASASAASAAQPSFTRRARV